jgi:hypothetical protein
MGHLSSAVGFDSISATIFTVTALILFFLAIRAAALWYWKVNRVVELLEKIEENTRPEK